MRQPPEIFYPVFQLQQYFQFLRILGLQNLKQQEFLAREKKFLTLQLRSLCHQNKFLCLAEELLYHETLSRQAFF